MKRLLTTFVILTISCLSLMAESPQKVYQEKWRPQYHYTPLHRWIGDPCGLVYTGGKFRIYYWGAAESTDLVHWNELNDLALEGLPENISPYTGSVVVDKGNTAGYGEDACIAVFTSHDTKSGKESQSIAFSLDGGDTYRYYDQNPVLDIWSTEFRDPTVIWDEKTQRWIMLVARVLEKKVAFYASKNLKNWEWLSDFGPLGDSERSWECPDMFQLPVPGTDEKKWVLVVSVNWDKEQYFIGDFDGTRFIPDDSHQPARYIDLGIDYYASRTFQDYDATLPGVYSIGWVAKWDYANDVPTEYGKGAWSLPRELSLQETSDGLRLIQKPAPQILSLRGKPYVASFRLKPGVKALPAVSAMKNQYELVVDFSTEGNDRFGVNLCSGAEQQVVLTYDTKSQTLMLDRTMASEKALPKFDRIAFAKVAPIDGSLQLDIFVDKSVVEVYANGGECVMTALTFPADDATQTELFSINGTTTASVKAYPMASIWEK